MPAFALGGGWALRRGFPGEQWPPNAPVVPPTAVVAGSGAGPRLLPVLTRLHEDPTVEVSDALQPLTLIVGVFLNLLRACTRWVANSHWILFNADISDLGAAHERRPTEFSSCSSTA